MKKMKSMAFLFRLFRYFYYEISYGKLETSQFVHSITSREVQHELPIFNVELKKHTKSIVNLQFASNSRSVSPKLCS